MPQGKTFFLRGGRPTFDIGWVGAVHADRRVDDGKWHEVVMTWNVDEELVRFYIDGEEAGEDEIAPEGELKKPVVRIGFTNNNFPGDSFFEGQMSEVRFYQRELEAKEIKNAPSIDDNKLVGIWNGQTGSQFPDSTGNAELAANISGSGKTSDKSNGLTAVCSLATATWTHDDDGNLRLNIPAGDAINVAVSHVPVADQREARAIQKQLSDTTVPQDLSRFIRGGPANYPEKPRAPIIRGNENGPFAVDVFQRPKNNPWNCQLRLTGIDFLSDETTAIVSAWDGSVWRITGFADPASDSLSWLSLIHI